VLLVEYETLDVRGEIATCLVPEATGHTHQLEPVPGASVLLGELVAPPLDRRHGLLEELRHQLGGDWIVGHEHHGFDGTPDLVLAFGRVVHHVVVVHGVTLRTRRRRVRRRRGGRRRSR
jgi:hypothetical protein